MISFFSPKRVDIQICDKFPVPPNHQQYCSLETGSVWRLNICLWSMFSLRSSWSCSEMSRAFMKIAIRGAMENRKLPLQTPGTFTKPNSHTEITAIVQFYFCLGEESGMPLWIQQSCIKEFLRSTFELILNSTQMLKGGRERGISNLWTKAKILQGYPRVPTR